MSFSVLVEDDAEMEAILNIPALNVELLDRVVATAYGGKEPEVRSPPRFLSPVSATNTYFDIGKAGA